MNCTRIRRNISKPLRYGDILAEQGDSISLYTRGTQDHIPRASPWDKSPKGMNEAEAQCLARNPPVSPKHDLPDHCVQESLQHASDASPLATVGGQSWCRSRRPVPCRSSEALIARTNVCEGNFVHEAHAFHEWQEQDGSGKANRVSKQHPLGCRCIRTGAYLGEIASVWTETYGALSYWQAQLLEKPLTFCSPLLR